MITTYRKGHIHQVVWMHNRKKTCKRIKLAISWKPKEKDIEVNEIQ